MKCAPISEASSFFVALILVDPPVASSSPCQKTSTLFVPRGRRARPDRLHPTPALASFDPAASRRRYSPRVDIRNGLPSGDEWFRRGIAKAGLRVVEPEAT